MSTWTLPPAISLRSLKKLDPDALRLFSRQRSCNCLICHIIQLVHIFSAALLVVFMCIYGRSRFPSGWCFIHWEGCWIIGQCWGCAIRCASLCSRGEDKYPQMLLVLGYWSLVIFKPCIYGYYAPSTWNQKHVRMFVPLPPERRPNPQHRPVIHQPSQCIKYYP